MMSFYKASSTLSHSNLILYALTMYVNINYYARSNLTIIPIIGITVHGLDPVNRRRRVQTCNY